MPRPKGSKNKKKLGDKVESITKATGIKKLVGECEGCEKRKQALNNLEDKFRSLFKKSKPLTEDKLKQWDLLKNRDNKNILTTQQQKLIITVLRENLNMSVKPCVSCGASKWKHWINLIDANIEKHK